MSRGKPHNLARPKIVEGGAQKQARDDVSSRKRAARQRSQSKPSLDAWLGWRSGLASSVGVDTGEVPSALIHGPSLNGKREHQARSSQARPLCADVSEQATPDAAASETVVQTVLAVPHLALVARDRKARGDAVACDDCANHSHCSAAPRTCHSSTSSYSKKATSELL